MNLKPLGKRIVVKEYEKEETTDSGIVIPSSAQEEPQYAEVIAVGEGIKNNDKIKDEINVGDKLIYSKYSGTEVELDGEKYIIIKLEDCLAIIE